ncbi:MAG: hypothetical protein Q7S21_04240 [archaeon]|nr:hypothetical protein [archaeon]
MSELTSIQLNKSTKTKLEKLKDHQRETFDDVVNKLISFTKRMRSEAMSSMLLSEKALAKEWLTKEEDEAWKHL